MRLVAALVFGAVLSSAALADTPFPDTPKNHWVYASMRQIRKNHLWYRVNDNVLRRPVPTRYDLATKTLYLAIDSQNLIDSLYKTTAMISSPADDPQSQKWAQQYAIAFPKKKVLYQTHLKRVTRLWAFFKPEIRVVAKSLKLDPTEIGKQLALEKKELDRIHLKGAVALKEGFSDVPPDHWAARAVNDLKDAGILVGYPTERSGS